jgi:hypothetical protein
MRAVALGALGTVLFGATTIPLDQARLKAVQLKQIPLHQIALPGRAVLQNNAPLLNSTIKIQEYPATIATAARFPAAVLRQAEVAKIAVYLPRVLPPSAPSFARVSAVPGLHRLELTFRPNCDADVHACHYATLLSETTIQPPADAQPITYQGVQMYYHKPVCGAYCGDGGLYFQLGGAWHAIEARGQLNVLEQIYNSYGKVQ